jgi:hypothetical protein
MSNMMIALDCVKINQCHKIATVMDKDILDQQKAEAIVNICERCKDRVE